MKIAVTGATGFIGRNIVEILHNEGVETIAIGRSLQIGRKLESKGIAFRRADILVPNDLKGVFDKADFLIGNKKPSMTRFSVGYMGKSLTMSIEKARKKLKYVPAISNYEGFKRYREWYNSKSD